jgi:hypothetical protein
MRGVRLMTEDELKYIESLFEGHWEVECMAEAVPELVAEIRRCWVELAEDRQRRLSER